MGEKTCPHQRGTVMKCFFRESEAASPVILEGFRIGDRVTIEILPARRKNGKSRGKRQTRAINAPANVKILTTGDFVKTLDKS